MVIELVRVYAIGIDICAITDTTVGTWKGHAVRIYVRDADTWKIRMAYVTKLAALIGEELKMDPTSIEDTIMGRASLFPHTPFVIKEDISESEYYRLRMLEKDWVGIQAKRSSKRFYPLGKVACDVLGYLGPISQKEYVAIAREIDELQTYLTEREAGQLIPLPSGYQTPLEVRKRLKDLQERAYTINDQIGKSGVEGSFDAELRGSYGKKMVEVDVKGNLIRELPGGRRARSGDRVLLTISAELQEFAERLLIEQEPVRDRKDKNGEVRLDFPWIKGGAIVALDPKTGSPRSRGSSRFDPNDFVPTRDPELKRKKGAELIRWLENESYAGEIWDGKRPLEREVAKHGAAPKDESILLSWERYLELVLPEEGGVTRAFSKIVEIRTAIRLQEALHALLRYSAQDDISLLINALYESEGHRPSNLSTSSETLEAIRVRCQEKGEEYTTHKKRLDSFLSSISYNDDKLLLLDLAKLVVKKEDFSEQHLAGDQSSLFIGLQAAFSIEAFFAFMQELHHIRFHQLEKIAFQSSKLKRREKRGEALRALANYRTSQKDTVQEFWQNRWLCLSYHRKDARDTSPNLQPYIAQTPGLSCCPPHPHAIDLKLLAGWESETR
jgi:hypothetical protein